MMPMMMQTMMTTISDDHGQPLPIQSTSDRSLPRAPHTSLDGNQIYMIIIEIFMIIIEIFMIIIEIFMIINHSLMMTMATSQ